MKLPRIKITKDSYIVRFDTKGSKYILRLPSKDVEGLKVDIGVGEKDSVKIAGVVYPKDRYRFHDVLLRSIKASKRKSKGCSTCEMIRILLK